MVGTTKMNFSAYVMNTKIFGLGSSSLLGNAKIVGYETIQRLEVNGFKSSPSNDWTRLTVWLQYRTWLLPCNPSHRKCQRLATLPRQLMSKLTITSNFNPAFEDAGSHLYAEYSANFQDGCFRRSCECVYKQRSIAKHVLLAKVLYPACLLPVLS